MVKKILSLILVIAITASIAVTGTMAYLTSQDDNVNVMTLGNVKIQQLEYERVVENGAWVSTGETDKYGYTPDKLQEFTQAKPLMPAVFADGDIKWDDRNGPQNASGTGSHQQSWAQVGASGSNQLFDDSVKNVQDKFVFVKNTGKSDAYVRTFIALEQGNIVAEDFENVIMTNFNGNHWNLETIATDVEIADNEGNTSKYVVWCATYLGPKSNPTGILTPGAVSYPSLLQVYMKPEATNEDVEKLDGNSNGTYDILVLSQAVQTAGFADAKTALDTGFGEFNETNVQAWFGDIVIPVVASSAEEMEDVLKNGGAIFFDESVTDNDGFVVEEGADVDIDLNGKELEAVFFQNNGVAEISGGTINSGTPADYGVISGAGSKTTLNDVDVNSEGGGIGAVNGAQVEFNGGKVDVTTTSTSGRYNFYAVGNGTVIVINDGDFSFSKTLNQKRAYIYAGAGATVYVNGGNFGPASTRSGYTAGILGDGEVIITGGTFGFNPSTWVADGYEAVKVDNVWTVSAK